MANKLFNQAKFNFIGEVVSAKEPVVRKKLSETSKWFRTRMSVGVKADTNSQFLNMEYIHTDSVKTCKLLGKDGNTFEVNLADTTSEEVLNKVADITKIIIDLETDQEKKREYTKLIFKVINLEKSNADIAKQDIIADADKATVAENNVKIAEYNRQIKELADNRKVFCHVKDAIEYLNSKLPELAKKKIKVTGNVKCNYYNGKNTLLYNPSLIEIVSDDTASQLMVTAEIFYDKDSVINDEKTKQMTINGYIADREDKQDKLYPITLGLNYQNVDKENAEHMVFYNLMLAGFAIHDKKQVHKIKVEIKVINGAEVIEFTEDCLTDLQKAQIEIGQRTLEDFRPKGNIYGNRVQELRYYQPVFMGQFAEGSLEVFPVKELDQYIKTDDSDMKSADITAQDKKEETAKSGATDIKASINSLFS